MINSFKEENRFLSNFVPVKVEFEGLTFISVEHAYVAAKTVSRSLRIEVKALPTAGKAKRFGKTLPLRSDWEQVRVGIMENLLRQKFNTPEYKEQLLSTGLQELIEGNTWHDNFWGSCTCVTCGNKGKNTLGKLLMKIRE